MQTSKTKANQNVVLTIPNYRPFWKPGQLSVSCFLYLDKLCVELACVKKRKPNVKWLKDVTEGPVQETYTALSHLKLANVNKTLPNEVANLHQPLAR